jgi:hypothetical protein
MTPDEQGNLTFPSNPRVEQVDLAGGRQCAKVTHCGLS